MELSLEQQIQQYLPQLGNDEKRSVLSVIKSFINLKEKKQESSIEYAESFFEELNSRVSDLETEKIKGISWKEVKNKSKSI